MGRDGIEPSTSGLKVQTSHQQAHPTTCSHNDLVVRGRAAWWRFEAVSVPIVCQRFANHVRYPGAPSLVARSPTETLRRCRLVLDWLIHIERPAGSTRWRRFRIHWKASARM